jgi:hypothetical protein
MHKFNKETLTIELFLDVPATAAITKVEIFPGIYIGDVVVSLQNFSHRSKGDMFKVSSTSKKDVLMFTEKNKQSYDSTTWRLATEDELEAFRRGITNINHIPNSMPIKGISAPPTTSHHLVGKWVTSKDWIPGSVCKVEKVREYAEGLDLYYSKGFVDKNQAICEYWFSSRKDLVVLAKTELKDYLPKGIYYQEVPELFLGEWITLDFFGNEGIILKPTRIENSWIHFILGYNKKAALPTPLFIPDFKHVRKATQLELKNNLPETVYKSHFPEEKIDLPLTQKGMQDQIMEAHKRVFEKPVLIQETALKVNKQYKENKINVSTVTPILVSLPTIKTKKNSLIINL